MIPEKPSEKGNGVIAEIGDAESPVFIGFTGLPQKVILSNEKGNVVVSD